MLEAHVKRLVENVRPYHACPNEQVLWAYARVLFPRSHEGYLQQVVDRALWELRA